MYEERKNAEEKKASPLTEEEFNGFVEGLSSHLEHKALTVCYSCLELFHEFISKVCEYNYRIRGVDVPEKMEQLERIAYDSLRFADPFITEDDRKLFCIKKSDAYREGKEK
jgi:hypothetical protein